MAIVKSLREPEHGHRHRIHKKKRKVHLSGTALQIHKDTKRRKEQLKLRSFEEAIIDSGGNVL